MRTSIVLPLCIVAFATLVFAADLVPRKVQTSRKPATTKPSTTKRTTKTTAPSTATTTRRITTKPTKKPPTKTTKVVTTKKTTKRVTTTKIKTTTTSTTTSTTITTTSSTTTTTTISPTTTTTTTTLATSTTTTTLGSRELVLNGDFETPVIQAGSYDIVASLPGWTTTDSAGIEYWSTPHNGVTSAQGNQHCEIQAYTLATMTTSAPVLAGYSYVFSFAHRGRSGIDITEVTVQLEADDGSSTLLDTITAATDSTAWAIYTFMYVPAKSGTLVMQFRSVSSSDGDPSSGNLLDAVSLVGPAV